MGLVLPAAHVRAFKKRSTRNRNRSIKRGWVHRVMRRTNDPLVP